MIAYLAPTVFLFIPYIETSILRLSRYLNLSFTYPPHVIDLLYFTKRTVIFLTTLLRAGAEVTGAQKSRGVYVFL